MDPTTNIFKCRNNIQNIYKFSPVYTMATRKRQKDKQRSTKHMYKTKDRATGTLLKTRGTPDRRVSNSRGTRRINLVISHE